MRDFAPCAREMSEQEELNIEQRREKILNLLNVKGRIRVSELSRVFGISEVTIRHDLAELEEQNLLYRVHGGAESNHRAYYTLSLTDRMKRNEQEKRAIAISAASMIGEGDTIIFDSGTTTMMVAQEIRQKKGITVLTNSLLIARELSASADINVIMLGGSLNVANLFVYGDDTYAQLVKYKADKMIMAVDGISAQYGVTTYMYQEAEVSRRMSQRVNTVIAVADYTKIGREGFAKIGDIDIIHMVITNKNAAKEEITALQDKDIEVITV
jgi:DeoR/GlpR family transcriptional regulator of sugar metabolism